jgi:hypothetical protein
LLFLDSGSEIRVNIRIRNKDPGSATQPSDFIHKSLTIPRAVQIDYIFDYPIHFNYVFL